MRSGTANEISNNWVSRTPGRLDRLEGSFRGAAYSPHRHDTYAIGITLSGVQTFDYRGTTMHSKPGQMVILHPDELHDGRAGTVDGFHYKTLYVRPAEIQEVLDGQPLPFVEGGISTDTRLLTVLTNLLDDCENHHRASNRVSGFNLKIERTLGRMFS